MNIQELIHTNTKELIAAGLVFLLSFLLVQGSRNSRLHSDQAISAGEEIRLILDQRTDLNMLLDKMSMAGLDYNEDELRWAARLLGWKYFRKGSYSFDGGYAYETFLSSLARGLQDPVPVVILPGIDQRRFSESVSNQIEVGDSTLYEILTDSTAVERFGYSGQDLFGRMLPDTYLVYWTIDPEEFIKRILKEFENRVNKPLAAVADSSGITTDELLIMASIVEWEARIEEEKPVIAGLYWNRIKNRMYLQADPTVNYALGERRRLLFEDYKFEHPYNTYVNRGLPPGPITNPALSTIEATLYYQDHDYLYMVANPEGGHVFTRTFSEHQEESEKWRRWLRKQYRIKRQQEREQAAKTIDSK